MITVIDKKKFQVVGRIQLPGLVRGIIANKKQEYLFVMCDDKIYRYYLNANNYSYINDFNGTRVHAADPGNSSIYYQGSYDAESESSVLQKLNIKPRTNEKEHFRFKK